MPGRGPRPVPVNEPAPEVYVTIPDESAMRSALAAALLLAAAPAAAATPSFVTDDWPAALAQARARGAPVIVDAWAPW